MRKPNREWVVLLFLGLVLAIASLPISAHALALISTNESISPYLAWSVSGAISPLVVSFPAGYALFCSAPFVRGLIVGGVATSALFIAAFFGGHLPGSLFYAEYLAMIVMSGAAAYAGFRARRKVLA